MTGAFFLGPRGDALGKRFVEEGGFSSGMRIEMRKILWLARIDDIVLLLTITTMVLKPTGDDVGLLAVMAAVLVGGTALILMRIRSLDDRPTAAAAAATQNGLSGRTSSPVRSDDVRPDRSEPCRSADPVSGQ